MMVTEASLDYPDIDRPSDGPDGEADNLPAQVTDNAAPPVVQQRDQEIDDVLFPPIKARVAAKRTDAGNLAANIDQRHEAITTTPTDRLPHKDTYDSIPTTQQPPDSVGPSSSIERSPPGHETATVNDAFLRDREAAAADIGTATVGLTIDQPHRVIARSTPASRQRTDQ